MEVQRIGLQFADLREPGEAIRGHGHLRSAQGQSAVSGQATKWLAFKLAQRVEGHHGGESQNEPRPDEELLSDMPELNRFHCAPPFVGDEDMRRNYRRLRRDVRVVRVGFG